MKRIILLLLVMLMVFSGLANGDTKQSDDTGKKMNEGRVPVTRTYFLDHVPPWTVERTLKAYLLRPAVYDRGKNVITVVLKKSDLPRFERLLKKIDVERKEILFRVFTVIASNTSRESDVFANKDLERVLTELHKVLSFRSFRLDGVSALTVRDGQEKGNLMLASSATLELELENIAIKTNASGKRSVGFRFELKQTHDKPVQMKEGPQFIRDELLQSETSVKENGFLVAGVSKIGKNGDSLVLIINAEIK